MQRRGRHDFLFLMRSLISLFCTKCVWAVAESWADLSRQLGFILLRFAGWTVALAARKEEGSSSFKWNITPAQFGDLGLVCPVKIFALGAVGWSFKDLCYGLMLIIQQRSVSGCWVQSVNYECGQFEVRVPRVKYGIRWGKKWKIKRKKLAVKTE